MNRKSQNQGLHFSDVRQNHGFQAEAACRSKVAPFQPIFDSKCIQCHQGSASYFGGLSLVSYDELIELIGRPLILNAWTSPNETKKQRFIEHLKFAHRKFLMHYINFRIDMYQSAKENKDVKFEIKLEETTINKDDK